jgi:selenocysteine lyase/cysteine desulfurase
MKRQTLSRAADDFAYLTPGPIYLDAACQSLRPQPVIDAINRYYTEYNACGGRTKYPWGLRVDEDVEATRLAVLNLLGLSPRTYAVSFTLNTSYGINLLLQQLPHDTYARIVTSSIEHNSVFLPTITAAKRLGVERVVLERAADGALLYDPSDLERAVVVVNSTSNIDGRSLTNLAQLVKDAHARGGIVIVDAAQTMAHDHAALRKTDADAICFSGHKTYAASLGVVVARRALLSSLEVSVIGGGMVADVALDSFELVTSDPGSILEPGLQAWAEIISLRAAIDWLGSVRPGGHRPSEHLATLSERMFDALYVIPDLELVNDEPSTVVSMHVPGVDSHRLAVFLGQAGIMARSGYFCAHYYLKAQRALPPLLRFSLGLHSTSDDVDTATETLAKLVRGLT